MLELDVDAISFDLFDTLIDSRIDRLQMVEVDGRKLPPTLLAIQRVIADEHDVSAIALGDCLRALDLRLRGEYQEKGRELSAYTRFRALVDELGLAAGAADAAARRMVAAHMDVLRAHTETPAHHADVLARLSERYRLALCSNFTHAPMALRLLEEAGLMQFFEVIVISETVGWRKPHPEIFDPVAQGLAVSPERILHIGDRLVADVSGAAAAGMKSGWLARRVRDPAAALEAYAGPPPDLRLMDLRELVA